MKRNLLTLSLLAFFAFACTKDDDDDEPGKKEETVTLQLSPTEGQAAYVNWSSNDPGWAAAVNYNNQGAKQELPVSTSDGAYGVIKARAFLSFDLSDIPSDAEVVSAELSLYGLSSYFTIPQGNIGDNTFYIQRVVDNWNQGTLTWNNQPAITEEDQVTVVGTTTQYNYNVTGVDVSNLLQAIITETPSKTAGLCLKLKNETPTNAVVFASSRCDDPSKRPKLVLKYKH